MASMVRHEEEQLTVDERKILTGRFSETHVLELYAHLRSYFAVVLFYDVLLHRLMYPFFTSSLRFLHSAGIPPVLIPN